MTDPRPRRITVLVGTDHHDFSRVVRWADDWQRSHPDDDVLVQHGFSPPPSAARATELVPPTELVAMLSESDVVVTHGGPGTIMSARHAGHHPLALPRDPGHGEHVDEHQVRFVAWAAGRGLCQEVLSTDALSRAVDELPAVGTRTVDVHQPAPAADLRRLEQAVSRRRHRRAPAPGAVAVLYVPDDTWQGQVPGGLRDRPARVLGHVSALWTVTSTAGCSCSRPPAECPFWSEVLSHAFGDQEQETRARLATLQAAVAERPLLAARRHPGPEARRRYLELARGYRAVCRAALEVDSVGESGLAIDAGGPLAGVLPLTHSRELDLRVVGGGTTGRDAVVHAALRYRGVPLLAASALRSGGGTADAPALRDDHRLLTAIESSRRGSIAR